MMHANPRNELLATLSPLQCARFQGNAEYVVVPAGDMMVDAHRAPQWTFFPESGVISLFALAHEGAIEISLVGCEGLVGMGAVLGGRAEIARAVAQVDVIAWRMSATALRRELTRTGALKHNVLCYTATLFHAVTQQAICNQSHTPQQRFARWLLAACRRAGTNTLRLKAKNIADALAVSLDEILGIQSSLIARQLIEVNGADTRIAHAGGLRLLACDCDREDVAALAKLRGNLIRGLDA